MNGGQVATRGFLLQTLIALLDILLDIQKVESLRLEPTSDKDKTDFVVEYVNGRKKAVQVKSSKNQIGLPSVEKWARSLKADIVADEYELCLIGPCSGDVTDLTEVEGVGLPTPKSLDIEGMLEQACHRLDTYLHRNNMYSGSPLFREQVVEGLIGRFSAYSTSGKPLKMADVAQVFEKWLAEAENLAAKTLKGKYGDGTLTDVDALKEYSAQFDRPALQDALRGCWSYPRFAEALAELIELLNTGKVRGQFVTKRRADFGSDKWREELGTVYHEVRGLRELYSSSVKAGDIDEAACGCKCPQSAVVRFDEQKRNITILLNNVLSDAGLPLIQLSP